MNGEAPPNKAVSTLDTNTRLAYERTYLAHERTQMGWVRTAIALISFGFTIAKFFQYLYEKQSGHAPVLGPKVVGRTMIAAGLVALLVSDLQHRQAIKMLRERCPGLPRSVAGIAAAFIALLGIFALIAAFVRQ
jgi:putative membrane protein